MKKTIQLLLLLGLVAISTGCASPYMVDRGRDAADIFTATVGVGGGAKARIGPLGAGLMLNVDYSGLKGGQLMPPSPDLRMVPPNGGDVHYLLFGSEVGNSSEYAKIRNKDYISFSDGQPSTSTMTT